LQQRVQAEQVVERGQRSLQGSGEAGLAPEGQALDLFEMYKNRGVIIETDKGIDFNFNYMTDDDDIQAVLNAVSEILENPTEAAKRGIVTNEQTLSNARQLLEDDLGFTRGILKRSVGDALNAEEMTALRFVLQKSAKNLAELAQRIEAGDNGTAVLAEFRRKMSLHSALQMKAKGFQTEIARALQAMKIPVGPSIDLVHMDQELVQGFGGATVNENLAKVYLQNYRKHGLAGANQTVAKGVFAKSADVVHSIYINGLLSWPTTALKNLLGTPLFALWNEVADVGAAGVGTVFRLGYRVAGGAPDPNSLYMSDIVARWYGYGKAFKDSFMVAGETLKRGEQSSLSGAVDIDPNAMKPISAENFGVSPDSWYGRSFDMLGKIITLPGDILGSTDDFFKTFFARGELYEQSNRQFRMSTHLGKTETEALDDSMMVLLDPRSRTQDIAATAKYNTLTADIDNAIGKATNAFQRTFFGRFILPFAKVPTNAVRAVIENSPMSVLLSSATRNRLLGKEGPKLQQRAMARLALGTGAMATFVGYAQEGRITGSMPRDPRIRAALPPGWQPYSFVTRGEGFPVDESGDPMPLYNKDGIPNGPLTYTRYSGLEPVSAFIGIAADTVTRQQRAYDPLSPNVYEQNVAVSSVMATMDYFKETPFLVGISDAMKVLEYDDASHLIRGPAANLTGIFPTPYSSVQRNITRLDDPVIRKPSEQIEYYSMDEVMAMYDEEVKTNPEAEVNWRLVGAPKKSQGFTDSFHSFYLETYTLQMNNQPWVQEFEARTTYEILDPYDGKPIERNVPFSVNPKLAMWNAISPFKISYGEAPNETQQELLRIDMPLTTMPKAIDGFKLPKWMAAEVATLAKSGEIAAALNPSGFPAGWQDALDILVGSPAYAFADDDTKRSYVQRLERNFYTAALEQILAKPENEDIWTARQEFMMGKQQTTQRRSLSESYLQ